MYVLEQFLPITASILANSGSKDSAVIESKVRKVSRAGGALCTASTSSSSAAASSSSTYKKELRFLTDFYPDQTVESGPLTRSKTRRTGPNNQASPSSGARTNNRVSKKLRKAQLAVPPTPAEISNEAAHSPTPDPSSYVVQGFLFNS